jgi:hypothetical protein
VAHLYWQSACPTLSKRALAVKGFDQFPRDVIGSGGAASVTTQKEFSSSGHRIDQEFIGLSNRIFAYTQFWYPGDKAIDGVNS